MTKPNWEEEFNKKFDTLDLPYKDVRVNIKSFIHSLLTSEKKALLDKVMQYEQPNLQQDEIVGAGLVTQAIVNQLNKLAKELENESR